MFNQALQSRRFHDLTGGGYGMSPMIRAPATEEDIAVEVVNAMTDLAIQQENNLAVRPRRPLHRRMEASVYRGTVTGGMRMRMSVR
jgi:hypothetical protein